MEQTLLIKFIQNFIKSLIIHVCRKLVFFIDNFFNNYFGPKSNVLVQCEHCFTEVRLCVLKKLYDENLCPVCGEELKIDEEILSEYNGRSREPTDGRPNST